MTIVSLIIAFLYGGVEALILTAIVISFSFFAFLLVLTYRAYQDLETDDTQRMRVAEPEDLPLLAAVEARLRAEG